MLNLENLKRECPETPDTIRNMIENEVARQMEADLSNAAKRGHARNMSLRKAVVIALAAALAVGGTVYAGVKLYQWRIEKQGTYGLKAGITEQEAESGNSIQIPEEIPVLSIETGYLPEGMIAATDGSSKYYNRATPYQGGISINVLSMDADLSSNALLLTDTHVTASETLTLQGKEAVYLEKDTSTGKGIWFDKKLYIAYPDYWQILEIFIGEDITKEEALKIAENLKVTETGQQQALENTQTWSDYLAQKAGGAEEEAGGSGASTGIDAADSIGDSTGDNTGGNTSGSVGSSITGRTATAEDMKNLHQIGDSFPLLTVAETDDAVRPLVEDVVQAKVTDVQVADDLSLLDSSLSTYTDIAQALDANGKLPDNQIDYIKTGDGINHLDEVIETEKVQQKLVYVTVEYTNTGDTAVEDYLFFGSFFGITEQDGTYAAYDRLQTGKAKGADSISENSLGGFGEMDYYDILGGERQNNHIPVIQPQETVTVHIAKIVNADELDKMYFSLDSYSVTTCFAETSLQVGYVDIRQ